ncbi:hypothetical protein DNTS_018974 [Danionella cerebrum]|uniref:Claudin n=1 Tax=Danionella cerebrum TaxID=2873325 RepID=A0A553QPU2_9TELE|nr:hypothetical protein DNTS_018974 [Danionella translucida]
MSSTALQTTGFVSGLIGTAGVFAATVMDVWSSSSLQEGHKFSPFYAYKGLWKDCELSFSGFPECQPLSSHPSYSGILQAARGLMIVAVLMAVTAGIISIVCLKCLNMRRTKLLLSAGILFCFAGVSGFAGASVYADQLVPSFMMLQFSQKQGEKAGIQCMNGMGATDSFSHRYTFGPALYMAWVGGALLLLGGILESIAFKRMEM